MPSSLASAPPGLQASPLFVFDTHPIQYRSPVFRELARGLPGVRVFYFSEAFNAKKWWFQEVGKIPPQPFKVDLTSGFENQVLPGPKLLHFYKETWRLLKTERPRSVLMFGYYLPEHWILWLHCNRLGIPVVFIGETFSQGTSWKRSFIKAFLQPLFFNGVRASVTIGQQAHAFYHRFLPKARLVPAKYCVDTSFFRMEERESLRTRGEVRKKLGISDSAFVMLFVGRLFYRKRPFDLLEIHEKVRSRSPQREVITLLAGNGELEQKLKDKPLEGLKLLGFSSQAETRDLYHAADLLVVPSDFETWGLVVNEAFAAGTPAIVTETCGVAHDLVREGKTGFVFSVGDTETAATKILGAVNNPQGFEKMGRLAQDTVESEYNISQFANAIARAARLVGA